MPNRTNGILGLTTGPVLNESQRACVDMLREALEQAEAGNIDTVGIIVCMPSGFAPVIAGHRAGDLMLGCFDMLCNIREEVRGGNVAKPKAKRDTILRVR